jgi:hypothetical protein
VPITIFFWNVSFGKDSNHHIHCCENSESQIYTFLIPYFLIKLERSTYKRSLVTITYQVIYKYNRKTLTYENKKCKTFNDVLVTFRVISLRCTKVVIPKIPFRPFLDLELKNLMLLIVKCIDTLPIHLPTPQPFT